MKPEILKNNARKAMRIIKGMLIVMLSTDYFYVSVGNDFQGKCVACKFDHSEEKILRYSATAGYCLFLGIFKTDIECVTSTCSNDKCHKEIRWYKYKKENDLLAVISF